MYLGKPASHLTPKKKHLQFLQSKLKLNGLETRHRFRCRLATPKNDAPLPLRGVRDDYKKTTMNNIHALSINAFDTEEFRLNPDISRSPDCIHKK